MKNNEVHVKDVSLNLMRDSRELVNCYFTFYLGFMVLKEKKEGAT